MDAPENLKIDPKKYIENINVRISEIENEIQNLKIDQMRNNEQYHKNFKMKYASRAIECANKIVKCENKIEQYKRIRAKYV